MIDQGAAFYWQYNWAGSIDGAASPFALIRDHVLLPRAGDLVAAGEELRRTMTRDLMAQMQLHPNLVFLAPVTRISPSATIFLMSPFVLGVFPGSVRVQNTLPANSPASPVESFPLTATWNAAMSGVESTGEAVRVPASRSPAPRPRRCSTKDGAGIGRGS